MGALELTGADFLTQNGSSKSKIISVVDKVVRFLVGWILWTEIVIHNTLLGEFRVLARL